ncbi:hypothetical protein AAFF_G00399350 [Aldrovandia affinis]|uniref:Uncharacterized protein n=1 Tax=Aldrovandia affinis TaxID=143900 RepID=A0AAD7WKD2_9TELE|nr:hypothetical protein AAFF_G00399350 [Aldrovandia affinis]
MGKHRAVFIRSYTCDKRPRGRSVPARSRNDRSHSPPVSDRVHSLTLSRFDVPSQILRLFRQEPPNEEISQARARIAVPLIPLDVPVVSG